MALKIIKSSDRTFKCSTTPFELLILFKNKLCTILGPGKENKTSLGS